MNPASKSEKSKPKYTEDNTAVYTINEPTQRELWDDLNEALVGDMNEEKQKHIHGFALPDSKKFVVTTLSMDRETARKIANGEIELSEG